MARARNLLRQGLGTARGFHYFWLEKRISNPIEIQVFSVETLRELSFPVALLVDYLNSEAHTITLGGAKLCEDP